jgi:hypothetical protein
MDVAFDGRRRITSSVYSDFSLSLKDKLHDYRFNKYRYATIIGENEFLDFIEVVMQGSMADDRCTVWFIKVMYSILDLLPTIQTKTITNIFNEC